jgi:hypothetical protein
MMMVSYAEIRSVIYSKEDESEHYPILHIHGKTET